MVEQNPWLDRLTYFLLFVGIMMMGFPLYYTFVAATLPLEEVTKVPMTLIPGTQLFTNLSAAFHKASLGRVMMNSFIMALGITIGKISISMLAAYAMIFFKFPLRKISFWMVFFTLMLPVEVRILPTYDIIADVFSPLKSIGSLFGVELDISLSLLNSYAGLTLPLIASATATFLFRQFFLTLPDELSEAAKIDGASAWQFFYKIVLPLSKTNIAALTVIVFVYGWNQYLWPLLVTTAPEMKTAIIGVQELIPKVDEAPEWNLAMAGTLIVMIPPIFVVMVLQKYFVKGLIDNEK